MLLRFGTWFEMEVARGGVYVKAGRRELYYSPAAGLSVD
jgi:hypothetical protein